MVAGLAASAAGTGMQIHLSLTGVVGEMMVDYVKTGVASCDTIAYWGLSSTSMPSSSNGTARVFGDRTLHTVKLSGLQRDKTWYYRVGDDKCGWSDVHSFSYMPQREGGAIYAVYADFGFENAVSMPTLLSESSAGAFDYIIHAGDLAYNLDSDNGTVGDNFMLMIEPIANTHPYMATVGNHETDVDNSFIDFIERFAGLTEGVGATSGSQSNRWYSFDVDLIHWVAIDTEVYLYGTAAQQAAQLAWLEADLVKANANRASVPWIIGFGHKGWYMTDTKFSAFDPILQKYGVDLYFAGHVHNYERFLPILGGSDPPTDVDKTCASSDNHVYTNPKYMTTIIVGSPGCHEDISPGCGVTGTGAPVVCSDTYGFGHLQVVNATHAYWTWDETGPTKDTKDFLWLIQENHGLRSL